MGRPAELQPLRQPGQGQQDHTALRKLAFPLMAGMFLYSSSLALLSHNATIDKDGYLRVPLLDLEKQAKQGWVQDKERGGCCPQFVSSRS